MLHQAAVMQEITCDRGTRNKEKYPHTNTTDLVFSLIREIGLFGTSN